MRKPDIAQGLSPKDDSDNHNHNRNKNNNDSQGNDKVNMD